MTPAQATQLVRLRDALRAAIAEEDRILQTALDLTDARASTDDLFDALDALERAQARREAITKELQAAEARSGLARL